MDDLVYICALSHIFRYEPVVCRELLENREPGYLFSLSKKELGELFRNRPNVADKLCDAELLEGCRKDVEWAKSKGVEVLDITSERYPVMLKECNDAPSVLFYIGNANLNAAVPIAVAGTRMASSYGRQICKSIVCSFTGDNVSIISGMAFGIDACAHKAALDADLPTVGVLPCGIDMIYPSAHRDMAKRMLEKGGLITEFRPGTGVRRWQFVKRNRIIAGMAGSLIIIESRIKGGAMITAELANSYGRDVYAVPGRIGDTNSYGCNYLISKNMAQIYMPESVKFSMGLSAACERPANMQPDLFLYEDDKKEKILLSLKLGSAVDIETLCRDTGLEFNEVASILLSLELEGIITVKKGNRYALL